MGGILFVVGFAFLVGFLLILSTSFSRQKRPDAIGQLAESSQLPSFQRFVRICCELVEAMKLDIDRVEDDADSQSVDIYATNPTPITGGSLLIHAVLLNPSQIVSAAEIVELSNAIIQDRLSKGIFITTSRFTDDLPAISELAPMEFIDQTKLEELARKYKIPLTETA